MKLNYKNPSYSVLTLLLLSAGAASAQTEADLTSFISPGYRGQAGTQSVLWNDSYTNAFGGPNNAASVAPGGSALANASVTQTTSGAFLLSNPGDIYSFSSVNTFTLNYTATGLGSGVGDVVFQAETLGTELDYTSVLLSYVTSSGTQTLSATRDELYRSTGDFGGFGTASDVVSAWEWNLPLSADVTSFSIQFNGSGTSLGLERTALDVAGFNAQVVPEPNTFVLAGLGGCGLWFWMSRSRRAANAKR